MCEDCADFINLLFKNMFSPVHELTRSWTGFNSPVHELPRSWTGSIHPFMNGFNSFVHEPNKLTRSWTGMTSIRAHDKILKIITFVHPAHERVKKINHYLIFKDFSKFHKIIIPVHERGSICWKTYPFMNIIIFWGRSWTGYFFSDLPRSWACFFVSI